MSHNANNWECFVNKSIKDVSQTELTENALQYKDWEWFTMWTDLRHFTQWMQSKVLHSLKQSEMTHKWQTQGISQKWINSKYFINELIKVLYHVNSSDRCFTRKFAIVTEDSTQTVYNCISTSQ